MSTICSFMKEFGGHLQELFRSVQDGVYDPRSIVGDRCLAMLGIMDRIEEEASDRQADPSRMRSYLGQLRGHVERLRRAVEDGVFDDEHLAHEHLAEWVQGADRILGEYEMEGENTG